MKIRALIVLFSAFTAIVSAESFRAAIAAKVTLDSSIPQGESCYLAYTDSALIAFAGDIRFTRGIEIELRIPQEYMKYRGSLALGFYTSLNPPPELGVVDLSAQNLIFDTLPAKLQNVYQIPLRKEHGLKASPYVTIPKLELKAASFPLLLRIMPVMKGLPDEIESFRFQIGVKPILSDEGALRFGLIFPESKPNGEVLVRVDDELIDPNSELLLKEGAHLLTVSSEAYRLESRRFHIDRARVTELQVELQDATPEVIIEAPANARISINGISLESGITALRLEEGDYEFRMDIDDYAISRTVSLIKGRQYRIALSLDLTVTESD